MSKQSVFDKVGLLGVDIDVITNQEAISYCLKAAAKNKPACYVVKPYVEFLDRASNDTGLQDLLNNSELALADGVALMWAACFLYAGPRTAIRFWKTLIAIVLVPQVIRWPLTERTGGINFTIPLLAQATEAQLRVFLIGSPVSQDIQATSRYLLTAIPGIQIVGTHPGRDTTVKSGTVSGSWYESVLRQLSLSKPDLILVGLGFPLQENVCAHLADVTSHGIYIGEGGTFDYLEFGGTRKKAPRPFQALGLEWLWRLAIEPSRLKRQVAIPRFIYKVWKGRH
jgi:N-acetylglucosaminyldiphosphoundecaprenol N-acetyl-beta-D-mannosaminyltransferase